MMNTEGINMKMEYMISDTNKKLEREIKNIEL